MDNQNVVDIEDVVSGISSDTAAMNTELEIIKSRDLLSNVVERLDLENDPEFNPSLRKPNALVRLWIWTKEKAGYAGVYKTADKDTSNITDTVRNLSSAITVVNKRDTFIFEIRAVTESPEKSELIANAIADTYIDSQIDVKFQKTLRAVEWLSEQVVQLEAEIETSEERISALKDNSDIISAEAISALTVNIVNMKNRIKNAESDLAEIQGKSEAISFLLSKNSMDEIYEHQGKLTSVGLPEEQSVYISRNHIAPKGPFR